ncbi:glycoside hydrolase family 5 protein [Flavobacterium jejuense]|uniref:Glycoside hydrolase family 5 protein n=1 Tax=Flavobacterium jejuense TaxID=1544455 RepID=A0ABX0IW46_9FLAO|nr:glycoside hydrolase family 5 protein [Flavobacterium jejuense]NHN27786.1 glycoside hydrolase family 5 protein [Flavobacterium jejuense]
MKKIVLFLLVITFSSQAQFVKKNGKLKVEGTQLVNQDGDPIVLRGVSLGWHSLWPRFYNKKVVKWLKKDWHCNVVRAAMGVEHGDNNYLENPSSSKKKVEAIIEGAIKENIYVIVDWHSHNINLAEAKVFFDEISKRYGNYPNIIYEVFNEPDQETWEEIKAYSEEVISIIRANDPNNIILVGSPKWDQEVQLPAADPIVGYDNLMYTMHFYAATHEKWLRDRVDNAIKDGLPIFISESAGMEATGDGPMDYKAWQEYVDWMESKKLSWITWSISDKDETCSMLKKTASSTGNWKDKDLKESGRKTRAYLRDLNN